MDKLHQYGVGIPHKLIKSFLTSRTQVKVTQIPINCKNICQVQLELDMEFLKVLLAHYSSFYI
jgi:hypothetical protein